VVQPNDAIADPTYAGQSWIAASPMRTGSISPATARADPVQTRGQRTRRNLQHPPEQQLMIAKRKTHAECW
jgi:hypothetical protein